MNSEVKEQGEADTLRAVLYGTDTASTAMIHKSKLCVANDLCGTMQTALAAVAEKAEAEKAEPVKE